MALHHLDGDGVAPVREEAELELRPPQLALLGGSHEQPKIDR